MKTVWIVRTEGFHTAYELEAAALLHARYLRERYGKEPQVFELDVWSEPHRIIRVWAHEQRLQEVVGGE